MSEADQLTVACALAYPRAAGVAPPNAPAVVTELGWRISHGVLKVTWSDGSVVLKQSLRSSASSADWPFDRWRTLVEQDCLSFRGQIVPRAVADVVFCDEQSATSSGSPASRQTASYGRHR